MKLAKTAGFCMGVKLAMDKVLSLAERRQGPVYTHGPLIHNRQAVAMLDAKGIRDIEDHPEASEGTVVIRAHGVPTRAKDALRARGLGVVDATCPHVLAAQRHIERFAALGHTIVIAGDPDHAEVEGLRSHAGSRCVVVSTPDEAHRTDIPEPACLVAQTTFNEGTYRQIEAELRSRIARLEVAQTICRATHDRQEEVLRLAREVEAIVVVGGLHSANTRRLAEIAASAGKPTFHVETAQDLDAAALSHFRVVGLTAGASTPNWVTRSVLQALEDMARPVPRPQWLLWRAMAALTRSNVYSALATVALTHACCVLLGIHPLPPVFLLSAFCYVFAVTTLNRLAIGERQEGLLPPRVAFYHRHARPLLAASAILAAASLASLVLIRAWAAVALMLFAYGLGVAYSVRLVPAGWRKRLRMARLKDVPASKDIFIALGWVVVCVLAPWLGAGGHASAALGVACAFAFVLTFIKANVLDLGDMQEDRLLGRETLPILLGGRRARRVIAGLALALAAALAVAAGLSWVPALGWLLLACPAYLLAYTALPHQHRLASDVACTLIADGALLLAGALALVWQTLASY